MPVIGFTDKLQEEATKRDAQQKTYNIKTCVAFMQKMLKKHGMPWCVAKLPKRMPRVFVLNKEKKSIDLTQEAMNGKLQIIKGKVYSEW